MSVAGGAAVDDGELVERLKAGDRVAESEFVRRFHKTVYGVCERMLRDPDDAMDCSQDAFIRALRSVGEFRGDSSLSSWVYRIATNAAVSAARKRRIRRFLSLDSDDAPEPASPHDPHSDAERSRLSADVARAVESLPPQQRAVFVLRHYEELSVAETARVMGRTEGAVKANYHFALARIGKYLERLGYGPEDVK